MNSAILPRFMMMATFLLLVACDGPSLTGFNTPEQKRIADNLVLHRTSGSTVTLNNNEGFGVIYGNIKHIGLASPGGQHVIIAFEPFSSDGSRRFPSTLEVAQIDLSSGAITTLPDPDGSIVRSLKSIDAFL